MLNINAIKQKRELIYGVHYLPIQIMNFNSYLSSLAYDGVTPAQTLKSQYGLTTYNDNVSGFVNTLYGTNLSGFYPESSIEYDDLEEKYLTGLPLFKKYKKITKVNSNIIATAGGSIETTGVGTNQVLSKPKIWKLTETTYLSLIYGSSARFVCVNTVNEDGTITTGTPVQIDSYNTYSLTSNELTQVDTNKFVYASANTTTNLRVIAFTVSGTTITMGTEQNLTISTLSYAYPPLSINKIDTDKFLINWLNSNVSDQEIESVVGTLSGTTITLGTEQTMFTLSGKDFHSSASVGMFSPTSGMAIAYNSTDAKAEMVGFTISDTTLTFGSITAVGETSGNIYYNEINQGNPTMKLLPNGNMWYFSAYHNNGKYSNYYFSMTGTTITKIHQDEDNSFENDYINTLWADNIQIDSTHWIFNSASPNQYNSYYNYLIYMQYNSTTGLVEIEKEIQPIGNESNNNYNYYHVAFGLFRDGKIGIIMRSYHYNPSNSVPEYNIVKKYSIDVYLNDNTTSSFNINNNTGIWEKNEQYLSVDINAKNIYLKLKNVSGFSVNPQITGIAVEVE